MSAYAKIIADAVLAALAVRVEVGRRGVRCVWRSAADLAGVAEKRPVA